MQLIHLQGKKKTSGKSKQEGWGVKGEVQEWDQTVFSLNMKTSQLKWKVDGEGRGG